MTVSRLCDRQEQRLVCCEPVTVAHGQGGVVIRVTVVTTGAIVDLQGHIEVGIVEVADHVVETDEASVEAIDVVSIVELVFCVDELNVEETTSEEELGETILEVIEVWSVVVVVEVRVGS